VLLAGAWAALAGAGMALAGLAFGGAVPEGALAQPATTPPGGDTKVGGWFARYGGGAGGGEVKGYSPTASFALEPGQGVSPGVAIAGFEATFDAQVKIEQAGKYRFGAESEGGSLRVTVSGGSLREPVKLEVASGRGDARLTPWIDVGAGSVNVQYIFTRKGDARARLRPMWERQGSGKNGFKLEAIPYDAASPIGLGAKDAGAWLTAQHGRVLLGELGCVACHAGAESVTLRRQAPDLGGIAARVNPDWAKKWMVGAQSLKPGSGMPNVLLSQNKAIDTENIMHFLLSTGGKFEDEAVATEPASVDIGRRAYQTLGCVACHGVPGDRAFKAPNPLTNLAGKWNASALSAFLRDPVKAHPGARMPSMNLNPQESDAVATYLINAWGANQLNPGKTLQSDLSKAAELGKEAFVSVGCANCHQLGEGQPALAPKMKSKPIAQLNVKNGCLNPSDTASPRYQLPAPERAALAAAIEQIKSWTLPAPSEKVLYPVDNMHLTFDAMGCRNCHEYHGSGGVPAAINPQFVTLAETDLGDEGRLPPRLNGVGGKLNTTWAAKVLAEGAKSRPYMAARMPVFGPAHTAGLAERLAQADGIWPNTDATEPRIDDDLTKAGQRLVGEKGLNCISCHVVGNNPPAGTPGPDITAFAARLRYEWWADYIHAPARFKPGTRMPAFFDSGTSNISDVLSGDPVAQADAMWAYFTLGEFAPAPDGLIPEGGYKLKVNNRPMIVRTFLREAGSRGIAVGFPVTMGGMHFAFDAERVRLVDAWKGDFLDASGAWAGRGGNVVGGQGPDAWKAPGGPAVVVGAEKPKEWPAESGRDAGMKFRGYRLDGAGVPTFMYSITSGAAAVEVAERFEPGPDGSVKRTFEITGVPTGASVWHHAGAKASVDKVENGSRVPGDGPVIGVAPTDTSKPLTFVVVSKP
jgi:mono/diheme cytochrome c family protein